MWNINEDVVESFMDKLRDLKGLHDMERLATPLAMSVILSSVSALIYMLVHHLYKPLPVHREKQPKNHVREPGSWPSSTFTRPKAVPYPGWSLTDTSPLPYRPFRHGTYHITMGIRPMKWDSWIELDNQYLSTHALKAQRVIDRGSRCCGTAPEALPAALEFLEELAAYLPERYPSLFVKTAVGLDNLATNESFDLRSNMLTVNGVKEDPMQLAGRLVQDDLAIMIERPDGNVYLLAGTILLAGFWRWEDKFGMSLDDIHLSGDVPGYDSKLKKGMNNFFRRIQPDKPVLRNNYFIQVDDKLAWSESIGSEDEAGIGWEQAEKGKVIDNHFFRSERQSLRRLPRTGGVVFTIRTYFLPITELVQEVGVAGRLASAVRGWGEDVSKYKGKERYGEVLLEYLDRKHAEEMEDGLIGIGMEEESAKKYPW